MALCDGNASGAARTPSMGQDWATYPRSLAPLCPEEDLKNYDTFLSASAARLFSPNRLRLGFWTARDYVGEAVNGSAKEKNSCRIVTSDEITEVRDFDAKLQAHIATGQDHIIFLFQNDSWTQLLSTEEMMRKILCAHRVHPGFLDFLSCFGAKQDEKDEDMFGGYVSRFSGKTSGSPGYEIFYNVRYVEETERANTPWSVRRMGVYQRYHAKAKSSVWILIQPTTAAVRLTKSLVLSQELPLAVHLWLLSSTVSKWRGYLQHLDNEIFKKGQAARFFKSDNFDSNRTDFPLAFSEIQRLQFSREAIQDAILILNTNLDILEGLWASLTSLIGRGFQPPEDVKRSLEEELRVCVSRFTMYRRWADTSLARVQSISDLIDALLRYRNDLSISQNSTNIAALAEASGKDSRAMLLLTNTTKRDSGTMRLIAVITMVYLPGTFMATLFSTAFVNLASAATPDLPLAAKEAGIYTACTVFLMLLTLFGAYFLDKRERTSQVRAAGAGHPAP